MLPEAVSAFPNGNEYRWLSRTDLVRRGWPRTLIDQSFSEEKKDFVVKNFSIDGLPIIGRLYFVCSIKREEAKPDFEERRLAILRPAKEEIEMAILDSLTVHNQPRQTGELARAVRYDVAAVRAASERLAKDGTLLRHRQGSRVLYSVPELKSEQAPGAFSVPDAHR